jgi:ParB family chromosome partitioning protein
MAEFRVVKVSELIIDPDLNPRRSVTVESCSDLVYSIRELGLQNPICVKEADNGYLVISGHRRYTAYRHVFGVDADISVMVYPANLPKQTVQMMNLSENLDRKSLDFMEECVALYKIFPTKVSYELMSKVVGKSSTWCKIRWDANLLSNEIKDKIISGVLNAYDIQQILSSSDVEAQEIIEAKEAGKSSREATKRLKRAKTRTAIHSMLATLMGDQVKVDCYKALAWAAGDLEDEELYVPD